MPCRGDSWQKEILVEYHKINIGKDLPGAGSLDHDCNVTPLYIPGRRTRLYTREEYRAIAPGYPTGLYSTRVPYRAILLPPGTPLLSHVPLSIIATSSGCGEETAWAQERETTWVGRERGVTLRRAVSSPRGRSARCSARTTDN